MYCTKCGAQLPENATVCNGCGTPVEVKESGKTVGLLSMIFGLVALGTQVTGISSSLSLPAAIAAVICGFVARSQAGKANANAQTGIICGFIAIGINVLQAMLAFLFVIIYILFYFIVLASILSIGTGMYI